jgi:glycine/D-amino acid oxidase-like deaminating enzyme
MAPNTERAVLPAGADVVVIGGGIIGAAITYYLAASGAAVTLLERNDLSSGTSGACGGSVTLQTKRTGPVLAVALESQRLYCGLSDELAYDLEYQQDGSLIVAETDVELEYLATLNAAQKATGLDMTWLDAAAASEWGEGLGPSVRGASFCSTDAEVNPLKVVFGFAEAARRHGARICTNTEVTGVRIDRGRVTAVQTDRGAITTQSVVNAAGVWSPAIGQLAGANLPVRPRRGVVIVTEPAPFRVLGTLFSTKYLTSKRHLDSASTPASNGDVVSGGLVLAETAAGNLLVGSSREFAEFDTRVPAGIIAFIAREAVRLLPTIAHVRMIRAYAGLRPFSPDGLPIIGNMPGIEGFVVATGHEGDGVALAPWTGKTVAQLITTAERPEHLAPFDPQRFDPPTDVYAAAGRRDVRGATRHVGGESQ